MTSNVKSIKSRIRETALKSRYERVERVGNLSPDNALPAAGDFDRAAIAPPGSTYLCLEESPVPGWELIHDYYTHELFERPNALLLFRVLEGYFGDADVLGAAVAEDEPGKHSVVPLTTDWGFSVHLASDLVSEVRSLARGRWVVVRVWAPSAVQTEANRESAEGAINQFIADLKNSFAANLHLFDESRELKARTRVHPVFSARDHERIAGEIPGFCSPPRSC
jgi:hypothetical protein